MRTRNKPIQQTFLASTVVLGRVTTKGKKDEICTALASGHPDPRLDCFMAAFWALIARRWRHR